MQIHQLCENLATNMIWQAEWGFSCVWQSNATLADIDLNNDFFVAPNTTLPIRQP
jgi:hypothetical protein